MSTIAIEPLRRAPDADLELPGSRSITNRFLLLAALAEGTSRLSRFLIADDTEAMLSCVEALGATATLDAASSVTTVTGIDSAVPPSGSAFARLSGTTARFIAPVLALGSGTWSLDGSPQLRARPMEDLFVALGTLGVEVNADEGGRLPATISGPMRGGKVAIAGTTSSQFLSGLLLAAPLLPGGLEIELTTELVSRPYVEMTIDAMRRFGVPVAVSANRFSVAPGGYRATDAEIEPDATSSSYFFAAAAATRGRVRIAGLGASSIQGEVAFCSVLEQMGAEVVRGEDFIEVRGPEVLRGIDLDLSDISDTVPTLAVLASLADRPTRITGVGFIRHKESDRIAAVVTELRRCGVEAIEEEDGLTVRPGPAHKAVIETYSDHRIAMAFSVLGLVHPGISIDDPECVAKTFPTFFQLLDSLRA